VEKVGVAKGQPQRRPGHPPHLDPVGDANSQSRNLAVGLLANCSTKIYYAKARMAG
jgi:hypothetical protein